MTARRDPGGMVTLPVSGYITIPAALRRHCDLEAGDQVPLAALPDRDSLAAYHLAVVDQAIRAHGSFQQSIWTAGTTHPATSGWDGTPTRA